ncbi:MAG: prefoldin subunit alpha [Thermoprotei archaeon]|jgi:prefoldin alpha subunit
MSSELERSAVEYEFYTGLINEYTQQLQTLNNVYTSLSITISSLEGLKKCKDNIEGFTSLESGAYVKVVVQSVTNVIIGVGAGVFVEKSIDEAIDILNKRLEIVKSNIEQLQRLIEELYTRIAELERKIAELSRR